jgi:hypothetical protein
MGSEVLVAPLPELADAKTLSFISSDQVMQVPP